MIDWRMIAACCWLNSLKGDIDIVIPTRTKREIIAPAPIAFCQKVARGSKGILNQEKNFETRSPTKVSKDFSVTKSEMRSQEKSRMEPLNLFNIREIIFANLARAGSELRTVAHPNMSTSGQFSRHGCAVWCPPLYGN